MSWTWKSRLRDLCAATGFHAIGDSFPVQTRRGSNEARKPPRRPSLQLRCGGHFEGTERQLIDAGVVPDISVAGIMPQTSVETAHVPCAAAWQDDAVFMFF